MNMYLLLRDNKQSGPYTSEQLREKGIKAYDLVWIEGKSAAWRYPSEVDELKPFSPVIEEQPFERFYKKPSAQEEQQSPRTATTSTTFQPVKTEPVSKKIEKPATSERTDNTSAPKKIYINFPASESSRAVLKEATPENEKPASVPPKTTVATTVPPVSSFPSSGEKKWTPDSQLKTEPSGYPVAAKPNNRSLLTVLAAACILLIGVIIGLIFSYQSKIAKQQELEKLVAQMQQKQQQEAAAPVIDNTVASDEPVGNEELPPSPPADFSNSTASLGVPATTSTKNTANRQQRAQADPSKKQEIKNQTEDEKSSIVVPTVLAENDKPVRTLESNRKLIFEKVTVENNKYKTGVLGGINNLELKLTNHSAFQLDEVEVDVRYLGSEGKVVKTQTVYFTNVAPGENLSVRVPKSNRGVTVSYSVRKIHTKELGVAMAGN